MNLIERLNNEVELLHLNDMERLRYIYLECCKLFSFDTRYYYLNLIEDENIKESIMNKKIDLTKVKDYLIICHTFSKEILQKLIQELTYLDPIVISGAHSYIDVLCDGYNWRLDATLSDLSRVKMNLFTTGFYSYKSFSNDYVMEIDKELGYIHKLYKETLQLTKNEKIRWIQENLSKSNCRYHYSDACYFYDYNYFKNMMDNAHAKTYFDTDFNFHKMIEFTDDQSFYDLYKNNGEYELRNLNEEEYNYLKRNLKYKTRK